MTRNFAASFAALALLTSPVAAQSENPSSATALSSLKLPKGLSASQLGSRELRTIAVQVLLDRSRHSPGVIDGYMGANTARAIRFYRKAHGLPDGSQIDDRLIASLTESFGTEVFKTYTISEEDLAGGFVDIPSDFARMSELESLGYTSAREMFAERFHMDERFLAALNPGIDFTKAGTEIIIAAHGDETLESSVERIEVRKADNSVVALDKDGNILASYPATIGSSEFPSPSGQMKVNAIAAEPKYYFDPNDQKWGPDKRFELAAGPNNPIGGTWIDLGKEGYGIHGTPDPGKVAKRASHGCVRLTNWDAEELARAVSTGIPVEFI